MNLLYSTFVHYNKDIKSLTRSRWKVLFRESTTHCVLRQGQDSSQFRNMKSQTILVWVITLCQWLLFRLLEPIPLRSVILHHHSFCQVSFKFRCSLQTLPVCLLTYWSHLNFRVCVIAPVFDPLYDTNTPLNCVTEYISLSNCFRLAAKPLIKTCLHFCVCLVIRDLRSYHEQFQLSHTQTATHSLAVSFLRVYERKRITN